MGDSYSYSMGVPRFNYYLYIASKLVVMSLDQFL